MVNHNEHTRLRIVRRAWSEYTDVACTFGISWLAALEEAIRLEKQNKDGEYLVRGLDQPNWEGRPNYQSGMDWL